MSGRAQGRGRQSRRERPQRNRGRDNSADSVNSTTSTRGERERRERSNGRNYKRRPEKRDERSRKSDEKPRENADKPSSRSSAAERRDADRSGKRPEKLALSPRDRIEPSSRENLELSRDGSVKGPTNDRHSLFGDDSRLSHLMKRITRETDRERRLTAAQQLEEFLNNPENIQIIVASADNICTALEDVLHERGMPELKDQVASCVGFVGGLLGYETRKFFEWIMDKVNTVSSDDVKCLLLKALSKTLQMDKGQQYYQDSVVNVMGTLQNNLENVDSPELLKAILAVIIPIALDYPHAFAGHFRDTIDILVGWHIDTTQQNSVNRYTSDCLVKLHPYWTSDMAFSLTLLSQFLEDMEAYAEELNMLANDKVTVGDIPSPYVSLPKLTALVRVFTTVVDGIGPYFTPNKTPSITHAYISEVVQRIIRCIKISGFSYYYEKLFVSANECLEVMCNWLQAYFACCCDLAAEFSSEQLKCTSSVSYTHIMSLLVFIEKVIAKVNTAIPSSFIEHLLQPKSPVMELRLSTDQAVLAAVMKIYQGFLGIHDVPLLETAYRIAVAELTEIFGILKKMVEGSADNISPPVGSEASSAVKESSPPTTNQPLSSKEKSEDTVKKTSMTIYEAETIIIFNLCALSDIATSKSAILGLWKLSPTLFELFTQHLNPCEWKVAACCPAVQYTILHALYTHAQRHHHFLPSPTSGTCRIPVGSSDGDVVTLLKLIANVLEKSGTPVDSKKLCMVWLVEILDYLYSARGLPRVAEYLAFDTLAGSLLPLTFAHCADVSLDACQCLLTLLKLRLLSREMMMRCFQDCIVRLADTNKAVRDGFMELVKSLPTDILTSFPVRSLLQARTSGKQSTKAADEPLTTNCRDFWWARKYHIVKQSSGSFHSNNFQVVLNFILSGQLPSKDIQDDWLARLFHSCNRTHKFIYTDAELAQFNRCESLLWFWATWEAAQFCIMSKLRTPLGRAQETFQAIEGALHKYASELMTASAGGEDPGPGDELGPNDSKQSQSALGPKPYAAQLQSAALLQFVDNLEKLMYNAYEGSAVGLQSPPKSVRAFFRTNRSTCLEWLTRIRRAVMTVGTACGRPALTVWHGFQTLDELRASGNTTGADFRQAVLQLAVALCEVKSSEAITGLMAWCTKNTEQDFSWMKAIALKSEGRYEAAAEECKSLLDKSTETLNEKASQEQKSETELVCAAEISELLVNEVLDCYTKLSCWSEVNKWQKHVSSLRKQATDPAQQHSLQLNADMNYVKALSKFEELDFPAVRDHLKLIPGVKLDPMPSTASKAAWPLNAPHAQPVELLPAWSLERSAQAAELSLVQAGSLYFLSANAKAKENNHKDGKFIQATREHIQQSVLLSESAVHAGSLSWPPRASAADFLRLQFAAAAVEFVQSVENQGVASPSLLQGDGEFTVDASQHDCAVLNQALRYAGHLHHLAGARGRDQHRTSGDLTALQLATAKVARKHHNFHLAQKMLLSLLNATPGGAVKIDSDGNNQLLAPLLAGLSGLSGAKLNSKPVYLEIQRECAKLAHALGHSSEALRIMCDSVSQHSGLPGDVGSHTGRLNAKSLLSLTKWLLSEHKLLTGMTKATGEQLAVAAGLRSLCELEASRLAQGHSVLMPDPGEGCTNPKGVAAGVHDPEFLCGQLLHLSTMQCPDLGKAWFNLAGWCYRWGRRTVEQASSMGNVELSSEEKQLAMQNMPAGSAEAEVESVVLVLGQVYSAAALTQDEDIGEDDQWSDDGMEATRKQLLTVCPRLQDSEPELLANLLSVWKGVRDRLFKHYHFAVRAYFMYLRMSDKSTTGNTSSVTSHNSSDTSTSDDDSNVTATLRLLRLLVKHAGELQAELEDGLAHTPTRPWKDITPQLFSRLNHPESYVRQSVSELLCRVARDAPHLVVYPAVVGNSTTMPKFLNKDKGSDGGLLPLLAPETLDLSQNKTQPEHNSSSQNQPTGGAAASAAAAFKTEADTSLQSCYQTIVESLRSHDPALISGLQGFVQELRRITVLWEELWLGSLVQTHHDVMRRQQQLADEIRRVNSNPTLAGPHKAALIREKHWAIMKPVVFALEQLHKITSQSAATPHEQWFQTTYSSAIEKALAALKSPEDAANHAASWGPFKQILQTLQARSLKRSAYTLQMNNISPTLHKIKCSSVYMPGQTHFGGQIVTIDSVVSEVHILPTKTKPKKIVFVGSDGQRYTYLFKGLEDLHLDERIMQFLSICNNMFAKSDRHDCPLFRARHYSVTPLGPRSGLIQWVDGAVPVFALYKRWQQREAAATALAKSSGSTQAPPQPSRPSELFYSKMTPALKEKGITDLTNRKEWPLSVMRKVLEMLLAETPKDLLAKELWCSSTGCSEWWHVTQTYARSTAVMSMIGYILGLGDRHLDNMLIDSTTGEVVHIDYNVCFEKGKGLRVPEKVPFRMTANLETALGVTGVEGVFRLSCEQVLKILKQGRETLLTLLEAFVYDPLVDWTTANDNAFASSFYGGGTADVAETKLNKRQMERGVTHSLFSSRVAEMKVNWSNNRDEMLAGLHKLDESMDVFVSSVKQLRSMDTSQEELKEQQETLKNAISNSSHPLHSVQAKYDEQTKLQQDHEAVLQSIREKLAECQQWQRQHEAAMETIHGQQLASLAGEVLQPLDLGLPSFAPSISFLQGAGQGHIVTQCEQLETELSGLLHKRRVMLRSGLDILHTYATVASQFPKDYVHHNRSHEWQRWFQILTEDSSTKKCQEILSECEKSHGSAGKDRPVAMATVTALMSVEVKLQGNLTEQNAKFIKFCDRRKQESVETTFLNKAVGEALVGLKKHMEGTPASLLRSLTCVLVTALCALSKKCLFMENTAKVAGGSLAELTSRDGDWFLDELCSMSGNALQLLNLLREYPIECGAEHKSKVEEAADAMRGVAATHKSFTALQELISNFRAIIVPETMKSLHSRDASVLSMMERLQGIVSSQKMTFDKITECIEAKLRGEPLPQECGPEELDEILRTISSEFEDLLQTDKESCNDTGAPKGSSNSTMTAGQMLLAGFNGLFTKVSGEFSSMLTCLKKVRVGHEETEYHVMKEAQGLQQAQVLNYSEEEQALLNQLFFIKRLVVMTEFFRASEELSVSLEGKVSKSQQLSDSSAEEGTSWNSEACQSEDNLAMVTKQFIANFLQQCMLGLPSQVMAAVVIKYIALLKGSAAFEAASKGGALSLEDTCKKVVDTNMKGKHFTQGQLSRVSSLTSAYDVAWRKHDFAKRLDTNIALYKGIVQRAQLQLARFQWLYEDDLLLCPMRGNTMITPARANVMADLRKRVQGLLQLDTAVKAVEEKFAPQESSIEQRLKWAAGANPALNPVLQEFEKTLSERKQLLAVESQRSSDISSLSKAILHFEALRTSTADALAMDKAMAALVKRCEDSSKHLEKCADKLSSVEGVIKKMKLVYPPEAPITLHWMKSKLDSVAQEITTCKAKKGQAVASVTSNKDVMKSQAVWLKTVVVGHQQLIGEVKSMLTTMAKDEEAIESRAAKQFISTHNQLSEECAQLIRNILAVCSGKGENSESRAMSEEKIADFKNATTSIAKLVQWIHDCLITLALPLMPDELNSTNGKTPIAAPPPTTFASALHQGSAQGNKDAKTTEAVSGGALATHPVILQRDVGSPAGSSPTTRAAPPAALQERNTYAIGVWRRVKAKLDGKDGDSNKRMSVADQVDFVIRESTSLDNLCQMYEGWTSWV